MKKVNKFPIIVFIVTLAVLLAVSVTGLSAGKPAKAYTSPYVSEYAFYISEYGVVYDIGSDCNISVTENLTIKYLGSKSTGFIRDIPVNDGAQVRNVKVKKVTGTGTEYVWHNVYTEIDDYISVDIGDDSRKTNKSESYVLTYDYLITNSVVNKSMLPINPIGHGWECSIFNADIKLILPDGFKSAKCYYGETGSDAPLEFAQGTADGRTVLTASAEKLAPYQGVTFDLTFEDGAIKNYSDLTPYAFTVAAIIVLALLVVLKVFVFNKNYLTPVVNYEAPNKMNPLLMGKLIDNSVNSEDVTSLIFYWASKGYIKINLDDKDDPLLIRIMQSLPEPVPSYERLMYNSLFAGGDTVKISQLKNKFYNTVTQVTNAVNKQTKGIYTKSSQTLSLIFAVTGGLLLGLAPFLLALMRISSTYITLLPFVAIAPMLGVYGLAQIVFNNRLKYSKNKLILICAGIAAVCLITGVVYTFAIPSAIIGTGAKIALVAICCLISAFSVMLISRTDEYTKQLNDIIGFKNFIALAEKEQLEAMLEEDPQFYYHILPYAQVLGVTDKWEDKFKDITVAPPQWLTGDVFTTYIEFRLINSLIRSSFGSITSGMVSRPSSSGVNGGGRGGFGGGFSGGGFGGGGGRGR